MRITARCALSIAAVAAFLAGCGQRDLLQSAQPFGPGRGDIVAAQWRAEHESVVRIAIHAGNFSPEATITGWAPSDFQARYKLPIKRGSGQIIAIVSIYDNTHVVSNLSTYRTQFGLGPAKFFKFNQNGEQSNYPIPCDTYYKQFGYFWCLEEDAGAEMISASCPKCTIYLVEADSIGTKDIEAAATEAVKLGAHVVANMWGCFPSGTCVDPKYFDKPGVAYVAEDCQLCTQPVQPGDFGSVAMIGATQLEKSGSQYTETLSGGDIGGCTSGVGTQKPRWQSVIPSAVCARRIGNDAAAQGGCQPGVAFYAAYEKGWVTLCGTSVPTALLSGVFGLAGNAAQQKGGRTFWLKAHQKYLYPISGTCNYGYTMGTYTTCAGWGSPNGIGAF